MMKGTKILRRIVRSTACATALGKPTVACLPTLHNCLSAPICAIIIRSNWIPSCDAPRTRCPVVLHTSHNCKYCKYCTNCTIANMPRDPIHNLDPCKYVIFAHRISLYSDESFLIHIDASVFSLPLSNPKEVLLEFRDLSRVQSWSQ